MFTRFFETLEAKNIVNTDVCWASEAQNHIIYDVFLLLVAKNSIYSVFWTAPSKNTGMYAVFGMLQEVIVPCKVTKPCKLQCFVSVFRVCDGVGGGGWEGI